MDLAENMCKAPSTRHPSEKIRHVQEVLHRVDGSRRDVAQEPGERLDRGRRNARNVSRSRRSHAWLSPLRSKQIVYSALVGIDDRGAAAERAREGILADSRNACRRDRRRSGASRSCIFSIAVADPLHDLRRASSSLAILGDRVGEAGTGLADDARGVDPPLFEQTRVCAGVDRRLRSEDHRHAARIGLQLLAAGARRPVSTIPFTGIGACAKYGVSGSSTDSVLQAT